MGAGSTRERPRSGFVLLEVVVALVLLSIAGLATAGMVHTASRRVARTAEREAGATAAIRLADSLRAHGGAGATGRRKLPWGTLEWGPAGDGRWTVEARGRERPGGPSGGALLIVLELASARSNGGGGR